MKCENMTVHEFLANLCIMDSLFEEEFSFYDTMNVKRSTVVFWGYAPEYRRFAVVRFEGKDIKDFINDCHEMMMAANNILNANGMPLIYK